VNWEDERYVRLYTRDTADLLAVGWEGRLVFYELMRKVDRAGVADFDGDVGLLAELLRIPREVCERGLERLTARGSVEVTDKHVVIPNFIEAQEARQSASQRQREHRARRRDRARCLGEQNVTNCDSDETTRDQSEPNSDDRSRAVTRGHAGSHGVTPSLAVPSRTVPSLAGSDARARVMSAGVEGLAAEVSRLLAVEAELRADLGMPILGVTPGREKMALEVLREGAASDDPFDAADVEHSFRVLHSRAKADPRQADWLNGTRNWNPRQIRDKRGCAIAAPDRDIRVGHAGVSTTGWAAEDGEVEIPS